MKTATYITNWLIVCLLWYASMIIVPALMHIIFAIKIMGSGGHGQLLIGGVSLVPFWTLVFWGIVTIFFRLKDSPERRQFHTSASIFLGLLLFFLTVILCVAPFYREELGL